VAEPSFPQDSVHSKLSFTLGTVTLLSTRERVTDQKSYQMGGVVLILAALTGLVGGFLHGPQPATLDAYAVLGTGRAVSHVAIAMTGTPYVIASLRVVLSVVSLVVNHFAIHLGPVPNLLSYVNGVWYGILGMLFMGRGGSATSV